MDLPGEVVFKFRNDPDFPSDPSVVLSPFFWGICEILLIPFPQDVMTRGTVGAGYNLERMRLWKEEAIS
jgi:hypothetical protein